MMIFFSTELKMARTRAWSIWHNKSRVIKFQFKHSARGGTHAMKKKSHCETEDVFLLSVIVGIEGSRKRFIIAWFVVTNNQAANNA